MNTIIKCLIVDDEDAAHEVLKNYIARIDYVTIIGQAYDAIQAGKLLAEHNIDLVFLDINMPEVTGIDFLKYYNNNAKVILTTAYNNHALEAYELDVIDYLLKPIPFNRFLKAVTKVLPLLNAGNLPQARQRSAIQQLSFKIDGFTETIAIKDILYFQALGNYVKIHTIERKLLTILTMQDLEKQLHGIGFVRIHKSYIVPTQTLQGNTQLQKITIQGKELPIGRSYKALVQQYI